MGGRIPEQIKGDVIRKWLLGVRRDKIAEESGIGKGTVSEIISQYSRKDSEVALIRHVALAIRELQTNVLVLSQAVRLKNILNEVGLQEEKIESLITLAEVHCFRRGLQLEEFFDIVENVVSYVDEMGIPLDGLADHIAEQRKSLEELHSEINDARNNLTTILHDNEETLQDLEDYKKDKPFIDTLVEVQLEMAQASKERDQAIKERIQLGEQIIKERSEKITEKYRWMVPEHEINEANTQLVSQRGTAPIGSDELYKLANNLFRQPSMYVDVIEILRKRKP